MLIIRNLAIAIIATAIAPSIALAQAPRLLSDATGPEAAIAAAKHKWWLKEKLYFAKRHRLVYVDASLLMEAGSTASRIVFNPFDDVHLEYAVVERMAPPGYRLSFTGHILNSPISATDIRQGNPAITEQAAEDIHRSLYSLEVRGLQYIYDATRDRYWPPDLFYDIGDARAAVRESRTEDVPWAGDPTLYAFGAHVNDPGANVHYLLEPLPNDPRVHLVWEPDPTKVTTPTDFPDLMPAALRQELKAKERAHDEFRRSLGEDSWFSSEPSDLEAYTRELRKRVAEKESKGGRQQ